MVQASETLEEACVPHPLVLAAAPEAIADLRPPLNHPTIRFTLNGPDDTRPIETANIIQWTNLLERWDTLLTITIEWRLGHKDRERPRRYTRRTEYVTLPGMEFGP